MKLKAGPAFIITVMFIVTTVTGSAQETRRFNERSRFYFSWGYNKEWYTKSDIHVKQTLPGDNKTEYTLHDVQAADQIGWDKLFSCALTIPQYNYRLGYFFNKEKGLAIELNFDHTKYVVRKPQYVRMSGTTNGAAFDSIAYLSPDNFDYRLNNGANFFLVNIVKQWPLFESPGKKFRLDYLGKAGVGWMVPHVQNTLFGQANTPRFQFGGWDVGVEGAMRATFFNFAYLEFAQKGVYTNYSNLRVYGGKAKHDFGTYELILSLGVNIPALKKGSTSNTK